MKNAQEAHEAIRPAGDSFRTPQQVQGELSRDEFRVYELIWKRTLASQMKDAQGRTVSLRIGGDSSSGETVEFAASGTVITFRGFLAAYEEGRDDDRAPAEDDEERRLPNLSEGDAVELKELEPQGHETSPPARYTEATLVRTLEELGIGRPSTYASILGTILDRGYVFKRSGALVPSFLAFSVVNLLEQHFGQLVDYDFTAQMEDDLDRIASGDEQRVEWLRRFYYGNGERWPRTSSSQRPRRDRRARDQLASRSATGSSSASAATARTSSATASRASVPDDTAPDELTVERAEELLVAAVGRPRARRRSVHGPPARREERPLRAVRHRGAAGGLEGQAAHGVALPDDVARHGDARGRAAPPRDPAHARRRAGRRGGRRAQRPLRAVHLEGEGDALARVGGAAPHGHARGGARAARAAEAASRPRGAEAAARASSATTPRRASRSS